MTINEQNLANAERLVATARVSNGGYDYKTYRIPFAHPAWPDEQKEEPMMCATSPDPTWRGAFVNAKEAALLVQVLAAIDTRLDDYVESGALTGRDAELMTSGFFCRWNAKKTNNTDSVPEFSPSLAPASSKKSTESDARLPSFERLSVDENSFDFRGDFLVILAQKGTSE